MGEREMVTIHEVSPVTATVIQYLENCPTIQILRVDRDRITYRHLTDDEIADKCINSN